MPRPPQFRGALIITFATSSAGLGGGDQGDRGERRIERKLVAILLAAVQCAVFDIQNELARSNNDLEKDLACSFASASMSAT